MSQRGATPFYDVKIRAGKRVVIYGQSGSNETSSSTATTTTTPSTTSRSSMTGDVNHRFFGLPPPVEVDENSGTAITDYNDDFDDDDNAGEQRTSVTKLSSSSRISTWARDKRLNLEQALGSVSERALVSALATLRSRDRDRDRLLPQHVVQDVLHKHKVCGQDETLLSQLQSEFASKEVEASTRYEELMQHLMETKNRSTHTEKENEPKVFEHEINRRMAERRARAQSVQQQREVGQTQEQLSESESEQHGGHANARASTNVEPDLDSSLSDLGSAFDDREQARLVLALEECILQSPRFELKAFEDSLISKDLYGNDQVSRQHVVQAAHVANLKLDNATIKTWLQECDAGKQGRGIYSIRSLVHYLKRSLPVRAGNNKKQKKTAMGLSSLDSKPPVPSLAEESSVLHTRPTWEVRKPLQRLENRQRALELVLDDRDDELLRRHEEEIRREELEELERFLNLSYQETQGYLPEKDVWLVFRTFVSVYKVHLPESAVHLAMDKAKESSSLIGLQQFQKSLREQLAL